MHKSGRSERADDRRSAEPQRPRRARGQRPTDGHASENGDVDDIVSPEIENAAVPRFLKFQPGELSVTSIHDRVQQEQERPDGLPGPERRQKKRSAAQADDAREQRDLSWFYG